MTVQSLYPQAAADLSLKGLYLDLKLHQQSEAGDVFIYSNYIASLDGRIALRHQATGEFGVPAAIANQRDWRLYQELAAQSDVMITSARYFRQLDKGCAQDLLPVGREPDYTDLAAWRVQQGLKAQPDVVIVSASLDVPLTAVASLQDRQVWVMTSEQADVEKVQRLENIGVKVLIAGNDKVQGKLLKQGLINQGYRSAYMIAGPAVHHTLLADGVLNRLFLSTHLSLLGGDDFHSILNGDISAVQASLVSLYLDIQGGQMFGQYAFHQTDSKQGKNT